MHHKKLYGTATVGTKGQVVIPAAAREALGIKEADRLYVIGSEQGGMVGFIKEDKLTQLVSSMTDNLEWLKQIHADGEEGHEPSPSA